MTRKNKINEVGNVYSDLVVIAGSKRLSASGSAFWLCRCSCGTEKEVLGYSLRSGSTRSCGCKTYQRPNDPETLYKKCFRALKVGAKVRELRVDLDYETFKRLIKLECWFCGQPPYDIRATYSRKRYSIGVDADHTEALQGIDRLDSSLGYIDGNCVPCCSMCNRMKSDFTVDEFLAKIQAIHKHKGELNERA